MRLFFAACAVLLCACPEPIDTADSGADASVDAGADAGADCNDGVSASATVALTERGPVQGVVSGGATSFLGIPYVKPPLGALRWRPPEDERSCWSGTRDATQWTTRCPQLVQQQDQPFDAGAPVVGEEDCLTLNVFAPTGNDGGLPVMVFIHGGGNTGGSAVEEIGDTGVKLYDGATLAAGGDVVVVTMQYRLGALGYLTLAQLDAESDAGVSGNYGLLDQQAALRWVSRNIGAFGGDRDNVLLFGESAGAVNTCMQLAAPGAAGLFHRAVIQSGSCNALTAAQKRVEGAQWLTDTGCGDMACLRAMSPEQLIRAHPVPVNVGSARPTVSWDPNVDGVVLPQNPLHALLDGGANPVPVLVGHNADETQLSMPLITTEGQYQLYLTAALGPAIGAQVQALYPVATYGTPRRALVQVTTDAFFGCQARQIARAAATGGHPTWRYFFSRAMIPARGAFHGVELAYIFQRLSASVPAVPADDAAVEAELLSLWTGFARTGALPWQAYVTAEPMQQLDAPLSMLSGWRNTECDYWDSLTGVSLGPPP